MKRILFSTGLFFVFVGCLSNAIADTPPDASVLKKLVFDALTKECDAKLGEKNVAFTFNVTNTWTNEITIERVETSCGCTVAKLPANPWHIPAGTCGQVGATVDLEGKGAGLIQKNLTLYISAQGNFLGTQVATVKVNNPAPPAPTALTEEQRKTAMEGAKADPQKIFKDPKCAECHVHQGENKWGEQLYAADCGICHDSPNRASFVPDLHALKVPTSFGYWKDIIAHGKANSLMPAFADNAGGPLSDEQVHSIAEYLARNIQSRASR